MKRIVACLTLAAALLAGQAAPAAAPGPAQASGSKTVDINHFKFHPGTLEVAKGTRVVFSNSASIAHTATDRGVFDSGHIKPGHSFAVRFEQKGTFRYHCTIHTFMHGKIVVG
ncbi:MAG TPA: cupredoxin domain-containing protein [Solirubrobacterales bacterium]|jgi:plastocyanin|nr:cupredoxin domain-containing protein [Solirubrobacterales bacterium]